MARDDRDYKLDLSATNNAGGRVRPPYDLELSATGNGGGDVTSDEDIASARPFLGVQFACCGVYQRIYRSADGKCYAGRCPRCGLAVRFPVGSGGTDARFFVVHPGR